MRIAKNLPLIFIVAITVSAIIFGIDTYLANRIGSNEKEIAVNGIATILALPIFIVGFKKATKAKSNFWVALNSLAILMIIGWTIWISLVLYAYKDFQL